MSILEDFNEWFLTVQDDIDHIQGILLKKLSDEPEELISDLQNIEAWNGRAGSLLAEANSWLDRASFVLRPSRDYGSEGDRKARIEDQTAPIRVVRDKLDALVDSIKQRLILGESILRYSSIFNERMAREEKEINFKQQRSASESPF